MAKYALVIGIDYTANPDFATLGFAAKDATGIHQFLTQSGFTSPSFLPESEATQNRIICEIYSICSRLEKGDTFLFYFAGYCISALKTFPALMRLSQSPQRIRIMRTVSPSAILYNGNKMAPRSSLYTGL